ncbi:MAG: aminoacyl-tRNA hydrolase, partial [Candidatus Levybacteria bacterium]|nr:aminoacyl-tRNA hydrolase [Candidatus Levybacteria bacterium]
MKLIVGLGNPGEKYEQTRHNLGFMVLERFLKDFEPVQKTIWENQEKFKSDIVKLDWQPRHSRMEKVILAKPKTYMNNSGLAVKLVTSYWRLEPSD